MTQTITNLQDAVDVLKTQQKVNTHINLILKGEGKGAWIQLKEEPLQAVLEFLSEMKALYGNLSSEFIDADLHYASTPSDQEQS